MAGKESVEMSPPGSLAPRLCCDVMGCVLIRPEVILASLEVSLGVVD